MAIPRALQVKLEQYEQEEKSKSSATPESTSDDQDQESSPETVENFTHEHEQAVDTESSAEQEVDNSQSTHSQDENFKRMEGRYKAEIHRLKEQLKVAQESHQQQNLLNEISLLKQQIGLLNQKPSQDEPEKVPEKPDFKVELTTEELETFGDISPVLTRVVTPLMEEINQLKANTGQMTEKMTSHEESQFIHQVQASVPNFGDADLNNPDWQAYLKRQIPMANVTIQQALATAHSNRDIQTIKEIFQGYAKEHSATESQSTQTAKSPRKNLADLATPDKTAVNNPSVKKYKYRMSDFKSKMEAMKSGLMSKEDFAKFDGDFSKAASAGLVSND